MTTEKADQILHLEPSIELKFTGPFTQVITAHLKLTNPSNKRVCFKVKTTAPKRYCVRPNSGIIEPLKNVDVAVMLQPFKYDPSEKNKHKFMVQTMFAADHANIDNLEQLWKEASPDKLMDSKLKCLFEMPNENMNTADSLDGYPTTRKPEKPEKASYEDTEVKRHVDDLRQDASADKLFSELSVLKEENRKLKESELRLRKLAMADTVRSSPPSADQSHGNTASAFPPIIYLIIAFIIGLIIGKVIL